MIWAIILLLLPLLALLIKPVFYKPDVQVVSQSEENLRLYQERCTELASTDLDDETRTALQLELDREFLASDAAEQQLEGTSSSKDRWLLSLSLLAAAIAATFLLYQTWGASNELRATELLRKSATAELSILENRELAQRLKIASDNHPQEIEWKYLRGRLLNADGEFAQAADVFADILVALPEEAKVDRATTMTMLAQARFFAADQKADEQNYQLIQQALEIMPDNRQAIGLAGIFAFELQAYKQAIGHWRSLWMGLPAGQEAAYLEQGIRRAAAKLEEQGEQADLSFLQRLEIKVLVDISAAAKQIATPTDAVFVLARAVTGPKVPLAAQKMTVADLPQVVTLSDAEAMMAGMSISNYEQLTLVARLSKSGNPIAQPGDWQIEKSPVSNTETGLIKLLISERVN